MLCTLLLLFMSMDQAVTFQISSCEQIRLSVDGGRTVFKDLIQLIDFYQMNPSDVIPCLLTDYITKAIHVPR